MVLVFDESGACIRGLALFFFEMYGRTAGEFTGFLAGGTASKASVAVSVRPRAVFFCESFGGRPRKFVGRFEGGDGTVGQ